MAGNQGQGAGVKFFGNLSGVSSLPDASAGWVLQMQKASGKRAFGKLGGGA
jgi:hypothetical protein